MPRHVASGRPVQRRTRHALGPVYKSEDAKDEQDKLLPPKTPHQDLATFLRGLDLGELDLTRERDIGRDVPQLFNPWDSQRPR